ncbi:MAG: hypothetical protein AB1486_13800, partial [Planctomycetota bacterium]
PALWRRVPFGRERESSSGAVHHAQFLRSHQAGILIHAINPGTSGRHVLLPQFRRPPIDLAGGSSIHPASSKRRSRPRQA